jgi:hypothetical protein
VSLGMKIYKKELYLGAEGAQSAQLCGLNCCEGVFSHSSARCGKPAAGNWATWRPDEWQVSWKRTAGERPTSGKPRTAASQTRCGRTPQAPTKTT